MKAWGGNQQSWNDRGTPICVSRVVQTVFVFRPSELDGDPNRNIGMKPDMLYDFGMEVHLFTR
jgi:hypothetical protein